MNRDVDQNVDQISSNAFYGEYHGHLIPHLRIVLERLRSSSNGIIWTAGDSSLDNKYWCLKHAAAVDGYAEILSPAQSICDVTYWLNKIAPEYSSISHREKIVKKWSAINTAIEATTLNQRVLHLLPQDRFIRDHISPNDVLIVSIGGNDIALAPTPCTIASMCGLLSLPYNLIKDGCTSYALPCQDYCCGCGPSFFSCFCAFPICLGYFRHMFGVRIKKYIEDLTSVTKPRKILVCMIYYPDENPAPSWAGAALSALGYNNDPKKLQMVIRKVFEEAISKIKIPECEVIPVPLYHVLDGKNSADYVARVEPSERGGEKMARFFLSIIEDQ